MEPLFQISDKVGENLHTVDNRQQINKHTVDFLEQGSGANFH